ncbi:MAG: hypothetical protein ACRD2C_08540 [Acidimicrobiales bacterium]
MAMDRDDKADSDDIRRLVPPGEGPLVPPGEGPVGPPGGPDLESRRRPLSRRKALGIIGGGGVVGLGLVGRQVWFDPTSSQREPPQQPHSTHHGTEAPAPEPPTTEPPAPLLWSDPASWGGTLPGAADVAVIERAIVLDVDTQVAGVQIRPNGQLSYDPAVSHTLSTTGNVVVEGTLRMRPESPAVHHLLSFVGVDEAAFVGDHTMEPLDSDVGVWVIGAGLLDLFGAPKTAWTHLSAEAASGATTITVEDATGWQLRDEVVITPTEPATVDGHWRHHDRRVVTAIAGNQVTLDQPIEHPHPFVTVRDGVTHRPEVLNVGRNVRIEGAPDGRAHVILLHAQQPQELGWVGLRHLGPRQGDEGVLGRYALHFHMCDDGVRGSTVDGAVALDGGNHAFVVHLSNGVALGDCVVHDNVEDAYWWDLGSSTEAPPSHDVIYERCVASYVRSGATPHDTSGFLVGAGEGNQARGCVASGVEGDALSACGFRWDAGSNDHNIWIFEDNLTHNNSYSGIYYWQNNAPRTVIDRFTAYHCRHGIRAGAYTNAVSYRDSVVYACSETGLFVEATNAGGGPGNGITYEGMYVDQAGLTDYAVDISNPSLEGEVPTPVTGCTFLGGSVAQVGFEGGGMRQLYEFRDCAFDGNAFWLSDDVRADSEIRVVDAVNGSVMLRPLGGEGDGRSDWNASVTPG